MTSTVSQVEDIFKKGEIISEDEQLTDLFCKPYEEIIKSFSFLNQFKEKFPKDSPISIGRLFLYIPTVMCISMACHELKENTDDNIIIYNCDRVKSFIDNEIIEELSPYIFQVLKWDLDRRVWKYEVDRVAYIRNAIEEIDNEFKGNKPFKVKKYINLFLDFFIETYGKVISKYKHEMTLLSRSEEPVIDISKVIGTYNQFKELKKTDMDSISLTEEEEGELLNKYRVIVDNHLEGLKNTIDKFDFLLIAFIEAQNDYKKFIENIIGILEQASILNNLKLELHNENIDGAIQILRTVLAQIPYHLLKNANEAYYHLSVHVILSLLGFNINSESPTNLGRIDSVIELENVIYIVEFKMTTAIEALDQIKQKKYYEKYLLKRKKIILLGIEINKDERNISKEYCSEIILNS